MLGAERRFLVVIGAIAAALIPLFTSQAGAAPAPDPGQQAADARRGANDAAARYAEIQTRYDVLGDQIVAIEQKIQAGEARATDLRAIAQRRAAVAYKNAGADLGLVFDAKLADVPVGPVQVIDGMVCPLPAAAFSDDFGPRGGGFHPGNDLHAPAGVSELAVLSGDLTFGDGGSGGMGAYIAGDDGNRYVYYHLSQYVGGPRHVASGEVIGKVGSTGNATGPHLHFEIHPGGGGPVDPFPTLSRIC